MTTCPVCSSDRVWVGWKTLLTDIPPFKDERDQTHSHAHGLLKVNLQCKQCNYEWDEQIPVPLRCWCGWLDGN